MEGADETPIVSMSASEDVISSMPKDLITNILDRLPLQDAVRTSSLSRNWRFKWTMLTQLIFDSELYEHLLQRRDGKYFAGRDLSRLLLHVKGPIKKFDLYIPGPHILELDDEDIHQWILFVCKNGIEDFTLLNFSSSTKQFYLPTHLYSCIGLKHLTLFGCSFCPPSGFCGFSSLLTLHLELVRFVRYKHGELISRCPLLENLLISQHGQPTKGDLKLVDIAKLKNLKNLSLSLCVHDRKVGITSLFGVIGSLSKLEGLALDFEMYKFVVEVCAGNRVPSRFPCLKTLKLENIDFSTDITLSWVCEIICGSPNLQTLEISARYVAATQPAILAEVGAGNRLPTQFPCLKSLTLYNIDFSTDIMVSWVFEMICKSPNLQTLKLTAEYKDATQPAFCFSEVELGQMQLQLQDVELYIRGSENEVSLIKFLLASSPLLKKMVIRLIPRDDYEDLMFAGKLLKLRRASPVSEIDFNPVNPFAL